jgi:hypothetical protein
MGGAGILACVRACMCPWMARKIRNPQARSARHVTAVR